MSTETTFWARRRSAVAAETRQENAEKAAERDAEIAAARAEQTDEGILEELGLPDPDSLGEGDDFAAFMAKAVPQHIRSRALRKLWRSNPVLACLDGLNDYDDDYLTGSFGNAPIKTGYQVGKGMLSHVLEMQRQQANDEGIAHAEAAPAQDAQVELAVRADDDESPEGDLVGNAAPDDGGDSTGPESLSVAEDMDTAEMDATAQETSELETLTAAPRRMQLRFAEDHA